MRCERVPEPREYPRAGTAESGPRALSLRSPECREVVLATRQPRQGVAHLKSGGLHVPRQLCPRVAPEPLQRAFPTAREHHEGDNTLPTRLVGLGGADNLRGFTRCVQHPRALHPADAIT